MLLFFLGSALVVRVPLEPSNAVFLMPGAPKTPDAGHGTDGPYLTHSYHVGKGSVSLNTKRLEEKQMCMYSMCAQTHMQGCVHGHT